jgi:GntR family transcriptional regulator
MKVPVPKYFLIRSIVESRLERNHSPGDRLPSEAELGKEFDVSRITVQQALSLLERDGLVKRERGRGTTYLGPRARRHDVKPNQLLDSLIKGQSNGFARLIGTAAVMAPARIAERLGIQVGTAVVAIDRVGIIDDEPILYIRAYLPEDIGSRLLADERALTTATLGDLVKDVCGVEICSVVQTIAATLADPTIANHLGIEIGAPVLEGERTYYDHGKRPVVFSDAFYRADRHRFIVNLNAANVPSSV